MQFEPVTSDIFFDVNAGESFFRIFSSKYSRDLVGSKYNLTKVTFNSWTDSHQISAAPNSQQYLILLVPFWKMMSFETKWIAFVGAKMLSASFVFSLKGNVVC